MQRSLFILVLNVLFISNILGQKEISWMTNNGYGIQFSKLNANIEYDTPPKDFFVSECQASMTDPEGHLLFYLDAQHPPKLQSKIKDRNQNTVSNSTGIYALGSICNGAIILPSPESANHYYLFTIAPRGPNQVLQLFYHIIEAKAGNVSVIKKNILLYDHYICNKLAAVRHPNGRDWWLMVHEYESDAFVSFFINKKGISKANKQSTGSTHQGANARTGEMVFSPNGQYLGLVTGNGIVEIFKFNSCSGEISLYKSIGVKETPMTVRSIEFYTYYGCSFSQNSEYFYFSSTNELFQYDLVARNSKPSLIYENEIFGIHLLGQHELCTTNGKIYIASYHDPYLSVIDFPNDRRCGFSKKGLLMSKPLVRAGLPNLPADNLYSNVQITDISTIIEKCPSKELVIGPKSNSKISYHWEPRSYLSDPNTTPTTTKTKKSMKYLLNATIKISKKEECSFTIDTFLIEVLDKKSAPCKSKDSSEPNRIEASYFEIYPNPATDLFSIAYTIKPFYPFIIEIRNSREKIVFRELIRKNENALDINCSSWESGNYICTFKTSKTIIASHRITIL